MPGTNSGDTLTVVQEAQPPAAPERARPPAGAAEPGGPLAVGLALLAVYIIWGSTYLGIRIGLEGFPPFLLAGSRFLVAGAILFGFAKLRGAPTPARREWGAGALVGLLLLVGGNGLVSFGEQWIASGLTALVIATTPLWAALLAGIWGLWPGRGEWLGLALGLAGVGLLSLGSDLSANPLGAAAVLAANISWALGTVWSRHLPLPAGPMASAVEMLAGGTLMLGIGLVTGEHFTAVPGPRPLLAWVYLTLVGSLVAFSAYGYLLRHVRPAVATSYAYVNPVVAVVLGALIAGEPITPIGLVAMAVILAGVVLVTLGRRRDDGRRTTDDGRPTTDDGQQTADH